ncbi:MAG: serine/threonine-protein phosphatase, partial [Planctomycetota bacterium]|nr:serine/threonine-protein phosphatase [Planctomycetota bacterium]
MSLMHILRTRALRDVDFRQPREVLAGLNERFPMRKHIYFTIAYGVFIYRQRLRYAAAGHPAPIMFQDLTGECRQMALPTRNP